jgi:hypothetical protein
MSSPRRTALAVLAFAVTLGLPAPAAFAQGLDPLPDAAGALDADVGPGGPASDADAAAPEAAQPQGDRPSGVAGQLSDWVAATDDNGALPFMIVDKLGARIFAFDAGGEFLGSAPVLVGLARGDDSAPGIGKLKLAQISADQRTTPAGRFVAQFGASDGHGTVLWVDLHDAISLHPVMSVNPGEHRQQRIKSSDPSRHRISYGCINVPASFYDEVVLKALAGGQAIVYVLPDTKPIDDVFPAFAAVMGAGHDGEPPDQQMSRADPTPGAPYGVPDPKPAPSGAADEGLSIPPPSEP